MLVVAAALEALQVGLGFFLLGKVKPEKSTGAPLYMTGGGAVSLTRRRRDLRTTLGLAQQQAAAVAHVGASMQSTRVHKNHSPQTIHGRGPPSYLQRYTQPYFH